MAKLISCDCKYKFNSTTCNSNQKRNNETCYSKCKKGHSWNLGTSICENTIYLKSIADTSVSACDKNISVTDIVSTKKANTIATNLSKN